MLKIENFKSHLNSKFTIPFDDGNNIDLELIDLIEGTPIPDLNLKPFTLEFKANPESPLLQQETYKILDQSNNEYILLLIPRKSNSEGHFYDSIIS